jgi:hypothetical protein
MFAELGDKVGLRLAPISIQLCCSLATMVPSLLAAHQPIAGQLSTRPWSTIYPKLFDIFAGLTIAFVSVVESAFLLFS